MLLIYVHRDSHKCGDGRDDNDDDVGGDDDDNDDDGRWACFCLKLRIN